MGAGGRREGGAMIPSVKNHGLALRHVSNGLQRDKDIVLEAVRGSGSVLELASLELRVECYFFLRQRSIKFFHYNMQI